MQSAEARESIFIFMIFSIQSISPRVTNASTRVVSSPLRSYALHRPIVHGHVRPGSPTAARTSTHPIEQATVGIITRWPLTMAQQLYPWRQRRRSTRVPERVECGLDGDR